MTRYSCFHPLVALIAIAASTASAQSQAKPTHQSWTTDRVELRVGDLVTIHINENLLASAENRTSANDGRTRDMNFSGQQNVGLAGLSPSVSIHSDNTGSSSQDGTSSRSNSFVGDISARVITIGQNGLLEIRGSKQIQLDKTNEELRLTGWVRPEDVNSSNEVESTRVADARVEYHSSGSLEKPKGHWILRLLGWFWP